VRPFVSAHGSRIRSFTDRIEREALGDKVDDNRKRTKPNAHVASEALIDREVMLHLSTLNVKHELVLAA